MCWGGWLNLPYSTRHRESLNSSTDEPDQILADLFSHHPIPPPQSGQEKWTGDTRYTEVNGVEDCGKFPFLCHSLRMRHISENNILWGDTAQSLRHRMQKNSRCQRISKGKVKYMVVQNLEQTAGSLTLAGSSLCRLPNINSIVIQAQSIMKCWRMLLLERKYILVSTCSCSQKDTHYSVWSYSRPCRFLFVHTNLPY